MLERYARLPIDSPRQIILVVALITLIISPFVLKVEFSTDVQAFLPQSEEVETYDLITEDFGKDSSVVNLYLTSVSGSNVLTKITTSCPAFSAAKEIAKPEIPAPTTPIFI